MISDQIAQCEVQLPLCIISLITREKVIRDNNYFKLNFLFSIVSLNYL